MKTLPAYLLAWTVAVAAHAQAVVPAQRQATLSGQDRATLERLVCRPLGVAATEIVGMRALAAGARATRAFVKCAPHVRAEAVEAGQRQLCERTAKDWICKEDALYLRRTVAGQGPFEIPAQFMTFEQAQAALVCFEAALRDQPSLLGSGTLTRVEYLLREAPSDAVVIGLRSEARCVAARLTLKCATEAGRAGPVAISNCGLR
jgi:hypothetical protein